MLKILIQPLLLRLWNQLYTIKVAQIKKWMPLCYSNFKSFRNKISRIFWFEQLFCMAFISYTERPIQWPSYGSLLWHHKVEIHPCQPCSGLPNRAQGRYWPFSIADKGHTKKLRKSKNPWNFVPETFKTGIIKWHLFFDLSNFYLVKLVSQPY